MPKIIDDVEQKVLTAARAQLLEQGYRSMSLRALASQCSIAVGTIYNYFENKDTLVARVIMEDWMQAMERMDAACRSAAEPAEGVAAIWQAIRDFEKIYLGVFHQFSQSGRASGVDNSRHLLLRSQLEQRLELLLACFGREDAALLPTLAEAVLNCALQQDITREQVIHLAKCLFD